MSRFTTCRLLIGVGKRVSYRYYGKMLTREPYHLIYVPTYIINYNNNNDPRFSTNAYNIV